MTTRRRLIGLFVFACAGCARPDWIESTLVTVDVTGEWVGTSASGGGGAATLYLSVRQSGAKVTGQLTASGWNAAQFPRGDIVAMVSGDVFQFESGGRQYDLVVIGDEMRGKGHNPFGSVMVEFRRR
jgi:hypothetical protein